MPQKPADGGQFRGCRRARRCFARCRRSRRRAGRPARRHPGRRRRHAWTDAEPDRPRGRDGNGGGQQEKITGTRKQLIEASDHLHVAASRNQKIGGSPSLTVGGDQQEKVGSKHALEAGQEIGCQPVAFSKSQMDSLRPIMLPVASDAALRIAPAGESASVPGYTILR